MKEVVANNDIHIICHNNVDIIHYILLRKGNRLTTGQPFVEERASLEEIKSRINQITRDESYFDLNYPQASI